LVKAVIAGVLICIPVSVVEMFIGYVMFGEDGGPTGLIGTTSEAFFMAALPEEAFKLLALWLVVRRNPYFDEHFDGIVYAVSVGLGFAAIENVLYVFGNEGQWLSVAIMRAFLAVPGHYAFAILMGYFYSVYHFVNPSPKVAACILLVPVLAHGIYDALAMSGVVNEIVGGIGGILLIIFCIKMQKIAYTRLIALIDKDIQNQDNNNIA